MRTAVAIAALLLGLLAGCGSDGDDGQGATAQGGGTQGKEQDRAPGERAQDQGAQQPSKAEFTRRANAICAQTKAELFAGAQSAAREGEPLGNEAVTEQVLVPLLEEEVAEIRALGAPPGDERQVEAILAATEDVIAAARQNPAAIAGDPFPYKRIEALADSYGLNSCPLD